MSSCVEDDAAETDVILAACSQESLPVGVSNALRIPLIASCRKLSFALSKVSTDLITN